SPLTMPAKAAPHDQAASPKFSHSSIRPDHRIFRHGCGLSRSVAVNTTTLAHSDAARSGRQPPHLA
ncbi:hypothetical protein, partial [Paracoccus sp. (in: a-proteobacteria)]|uniref:hypothetical protein n=1 Tax=Paracoccus sp. TaxID=267 RepID=UPI00322047EC